MREANATQRRWAGKPGAYGTGNKPTYHIVGKFGEAAVEKWLQARGLPVDSAFRDRSRAAEADILVAGTRIEVKCWNFGTWNQGGRCVSPEQEREISDKADIIAWCRLGRHLSPAALLDASAASLSVHLMGFSTVAEVLARPLEDTSFNEIPRWNHRMPESNLRDLDGLFAPRP